MAKHGLSPFIDGSTRREPDLELNYPSISSLCRGKNFAPRLKEGDIVIYVTKKGIYNNVKPNHYRVTAILKVKKKFCNHTLAAEWYKNHDRRIPSNCIVKGNKPINAAMTIVDGCETAEGAYIYRSKNFSDFFACSNEVKPNLKNPPILNEREVFPNGVPYTQNPKENAVTIEQLEELKKILRESHLLNKSTAL